MADVNQTIDLSDNDAHDLYNSSRLCTAFWVLAYDGADIAVHIDGFHPGTPDKYWHVIRAGNQYVFRYNSIKHVEVKRLSAVATTVDYGPLDFTL